MEDIEKSLKNASHGLAAVQKIQQGYDKVGWRMSEPEFRKLRHIFIHLSKGMGALANVTEHWEHDAFDRGLGEAGISVKEGREVIKSLVGDLVYHSAQLSSMVELDLASCFFEKISQNATRFAPDSVFPSIATLASKAVKPVARLEQDYSPPK